MPMSTSESKPASEAPAPTKKRKPRRHKYNAKGVTKDGHYFPSLAEATRYDQLKQLQSDGLITGLELQPKFKILINNQKVCDYIADFRYRGITPDGRHMDKVYVEDVKGVVTAMYVLKRKMLLAAYADMADCFYEIPSGQVHKFEGLVPGDTELMANSTIKQGYNKQWNRGGKG